MRQSGGRGGGGEGDIGCCFQVHVMLVHFYSEELKENPNHYPGNARNIGVVLSRLYGLYDKNVTSYQKS